MEVKTILEGMEQVVANTPKRVPKVTDFFAWYLQLSEAQFVLLTYIMSMGEESITLSSIGKAMGISYLKMLEYSDDIDVLVRRHFIRRELSCSRISYRVTREAMEAISHNRNYIYRPPIISTTSQFFAIVDRLIRRLIKENLLFEDFRSELESYLENAKSLPIAGVIRKHPSLDFCDIVVLLYIACSLCVDNDEQISTDEMYGLFGYDTSREIEMSLNNGGHILIRLNLVQRSCEHGMASQEYFCLTPAAKQAIFPGQTFTDIQSIHHDTIKSSDIVKKRLFFSVELKKQVDELVNLIKPRMFKQVEERLAAQGMRKGFACLFYGPPGTGKTETALQCARIAGRDIVSIDASKLKDKWVGESEKQIKAVFQRYRHLYDDSTKCPILLFNEADAVFGKRFSDVNSSVDQMSNACQNIILQEMERFNGILIATTNMNEQMDKAFERRFIYKINFTKPDTHTQAAIWRSNIENLSNYDSVRLADKYSLSGGQIENVARKSVVHYVLSGDCVTYDELCKLCEAEVTENKNNKVGYNINK